MRLIDADALKEDILGLRDCDNGFSDTYDKACIIGVIDEQPSAQPEQSPEIQDIINYLDTVLHPIISPEHWNVYSELHDMISTLPSADPDDAALHESCTDCPLYDHDRHRCPRFNKVIPTTIQEILDTQTQRWIPVAERLPVEGESVLLCNSYGDMTLGRLVRTNEGCNWDIYAWWCDIYDWVAWMPLPEPYREEEKNE